MDAVDRLLSQMTLEEKIGQLNLLTADQAVTGASGTGDLNANDFTGEASVASSISGAARRSPGCRSSPSRQRALVCRSSSQWTRCTGSGRSFPFRSPRRAPSTPISGSAPRAPRRCEAAADGVDLTFAPMLDVARDPRWGRIVESPGEDPCVPPPSPPRRSGASRARRFQRAKAIGATAKHFALTGRRSPDATTPPRTFPSARCTKSICRPSRPRFERDALRSWPPTRASPESR